MLHINANPGAGDAGATQKIHSGRNVTARNSQVARRAQVIRAELMGDNTCTCTGFKTNGTTPVLAMCRELIAAGLNPDQALEVWRGATLALRIRSIGEAARLTVKTAGNGTPIFALDGAQEGAAWPVAAEMAPVDCGSLP